jgi:hypothetical protein
MIRPPILGCVSQIITTPIFLIVLWWLSGSTDILLDLLVSRKEMFIFLAVGFSLLNIIPLLASLPYMIMFFFSLPIEPKSDLRESRINNNQVAIKDETKNLLVKYGIPFLIFFVVGLFFLVPYASGTKWETALLNSTLAVFPFHIAFLVMYVVRIGMEVILQFLRYIIQYNHS